MLSKVLRVLIILSAVGITAVLLHRVVLAHGAMQTPMSRVYSCYLENPETPDTLACKDAIAMSGTQPLYDWNEVNLRNAGGNHRALIPDGKLCSAGRDKYAAFDQPRLDWPVTILPASGTYTFYFTAAVPHNMGHFELYVTRNGYDPLQPLKWSDLEETPFLTVQEPPVIDGYYVFSGALPGGKSGRHLIYTIWQRHDSAEAFYSCSDVWFGTSPTPQPTAPPMCTAPDWSASIVYQMNDLVNHNGKQWRAKWSNTSTEPSSAGGVSPWEIQGYCQRGGGVTSTFTPTSVTSTPTASRTPTGVTNTPTRTPTAVFTPTGVTTTPSFTPTSTATQSPGACGPVTGTITSPFTHDGAGAFCWQTSNLGSYINSWNLVSLTINGVDFTNKYAFASSYPPQINGYWYVSYTGNFPWSHFEAK